MRVVKIAVGFALVIGGVALLALPGPGWLTIAAGLALLSNEFHWAHCALVRIKSTAIQFGDRMKGGRHGSEAPDTNRSNRE